MCALCGLCAQQFQAYLAGVAIFFADATYEPVIAMLTTEGVGKAGWTPKHNAQAGMQRLIFVCQQVCDTHQCGYLLFRPVSDLCVCVVSFLVCSSSMRWMRRQRRTGSGSCTPRSCKSRCCTRCIITPCSELLSSPRTRSASLWAQARSLGLWPRKARTSHTTSRPRNTYPTQKVKRSRVSPARSSRRIASADRRAPCSRCPSTIRIAIMR